MKGSLSENQAAVLLGIYTAVQSLEGGFVTEEVLARAGALAGIDAPMQFSGLECAGLIRR